MAQNPNITQLDTPQVLKRVFDELNDAVRVEIGTGTSFGINLNADSGDSVISVPTVYEGKVSLLSTSSGVVIAPVSCIGLKSFNLYTNTTATLVGPQVCTLQISPSDSDNVWISTSLTVTPSLTANGVVAGTINTSIVARRMRVSIAAPITSGTFDLYLVAQSV